MKRIIVFSGITLCIFFCGTNVEAQTAIETVLSDIEKNNTTLTAYRQQMEADKLGNRTGIFPHNPEFGYAYHWGDPVSIGIKKNISLMQSFEFPTAYVHMNRIANTKNSQLETGYQAQRINILLEAYLTTIEVIHANRLHQEISIRLSHANDLRQAHEKMFEGGQISQIEFNKAKLHQSLAEQQLARVSADREKYRAELRRLNGSIPIDISLSQFEIIRIPANFEEWILDMQSISPELRWLQQEISINQLQQRLARSKALPALSAGYVSESLTHEQFRGWAVGISIPLWEQKNTVKLARAQSQATAQIYTDRMLQFENQLRSLYTYAVSLQQLANDLRQDIADASNMTLIEKAWQNGEINLLEYLLELSFLYEATDQLIETERELAVTTALLQQFTL